MRTAASARFLALVIPLIAGRCDAQTSPLPSQFQWKTGTPLLTARDVGGWPWHAVKDPTILRHEGRWHLFATVRGSQRSHAVMYVAFDDWSQADQADRHILPMHEGFFCAPQVFWFEPAQSWYMVCQAASEAWGEPPYRPAFSTTKTLDDPASWAPLQPMFDDKPKNVKAWLDFWVICDAAKAHLFFTSLDGNMWRCETTLDQFPRGWSQPVLALQGDIFEASHTYKLQGHDRWLTIIEAQNGHGFRYFKAYTADRLDGAWQPLAATRENAFASLRNVEQANGRWTDAVSHGELLRAGVDQKLEIDPKNLRFLFQGVGNAERAGKPYGEIPWRLGLLESSAE